MLLPITRPRGSKPACLTSRNSLTDRSLVKRCALRIPPRRSSACCGRSFGLFVIGVALVGGLALGLAGLLGQLLALVVALDDLAALSPQRHHRQDERRHLR